MIRFIFFALFSLLLNACDQEAAFETLVPKEESAIAKELIAKLAAKDFSAVESRLDSNVRTPDVREKLEQMVRVLPTGALKSVRTVGANTTTSSTGTTYDLSYEYEYADGWVVASAVLERRDGQVTLQGIHFSPAKESLATLNRFTFEGKGIAHYIVFASSIFIPLLIVYTLVVCSRTKIPKRKWLWLLFVAVGFVQFQFNWTDGTWGVQPISFVLLGAGFAKAGSVAPWMFRLAFPLGAVVFLAKRRSLQRSNDA
jgi:hypothetical protein